MAARKSENSDRRTYVSWVTAEPDSAPPARRGLRQRLEGFSLVDAFIAGLAIAAFDLIGVLVVSGWQSSRCGESCGLRTQLHLMHVAAVLTLVAVALPPLVVALLARRARVAACVVQGLLCLLVVINVVTTQHRLVPRIEGTAPCWNPVYSDAECPWGPKD